MFEARSCREVSGFCFRGECTQKVAYGEAILNFFVGRTFMRHVWTTVSSSMSVFCPRYIIARWWREREEPNFLTVCKHASGACMHNQFVRERTHSLHSMWACMLSSSWYIDTTSSWHRIHLKHKNGCYYDDGGACPSTSSIKQCTTTSSCSCSTYFRMLMPMTTWEQDVAAMQGVGFACEIPTHFLLAPLTDWLM